MEESWFTSLGWQLGTGGLAACFIGPMVMQAPVSLQSWSGVGRELVCRLRAVSPGWLVPSLELRGGTWCLQRIEGHVLGAIAQWGVLLQPCNPLSCSEPSFILLSFLKEMATGLCFSG